MNSYLEHLKKSLQAQLVKFINKVKEIEYKKAGISMGQGQPSSNFSIAQKNSLNSLKRTVEDLYAEKMQLNDVIDYFENKIKNNGGCDNDIEESYFLATYELYTKKQVLNKIVESKEFKNIIKNLKSKI